jgi:hypothetical protein
MKAKTSVLTLALCFLVGAVCFASDAQMGTWKLNETKSKLATGMPKNSTIVFEAAGDSIKVTIDGGLMIFFSCTGIVDIANCLSHLCSTQRLPSNAGLASWQIYSRNMAALYSVTKRGFLNGWPRHRMNVMPSFEGSWNQPAITLEVLCTHDPDLKQRISPAPYEKAFKYERQPGL